MVWTVLKQSLMGTTLPINVAACIFQKEVPSFNEMLFLVSPTTSIAIINGQARPLFTLITVLTIMQLIF
jgi:hypothetical protein